MSRTDNAASRIAAAIAAIATKSEEALWAILEDDSEPDWRVLAAETELDRRDYDKSDASSQTVPS